MRPWPQNLDNICSYDWVIAISFLLLNWWFISRPPKEWQQAGVAEFWANQGSLCWPISTAEPPEALSSHKRWEPVHVAASVGLRCGSPLWVFLCFSPWFSEPELGQWATLLLFLFRKVILVQYRRPENDNMHKEENVDCFAFASQRKTLLVNCLPDTW